MAGLKETVTVTRDVPSNIADLVYFAKYLQEHHGVDLKGISDEKLVLAARSFWDRQHGHD